MTGAAYIRVSTEDQLEFSPDSQLKKIREYADQHQITIPEDQIYLDEGISGRSASKRPAFMRMIELPGYPRMEILPLRPKPPGQYPLQIHAPQGMRH